MNEGNISEEKNVENECDKESPIATLIVKVCVLHNFT